LLLRNSQKISPPITKPPSHYSRSPAKIPLSIFPPLTLIKEFETIGGQTFFKWAVENDFLTKDPSRLVRFERVPTKEAKYFDAAQIEAFRKALQGMGRDEAIFTLFIETGLRLSELRSLNCGQVRGKASFLIVGKGNKSREVFLSASLQEMIANHIGKRKDREPIFLSSWGRRLCGGQITYLFKAYCEKASLPILSPHALRHSFGTALYESTKDIRLTQELLGHSTPSMTMRYSHINSASKREAINRLWA
jgi:integrase/recombinase XerD